MGFEPTSRLTSGNGFQDRHHQPLGHPSVTTHIIHYSEIYLLGTKESSPDFPIGIERVARAIQIKNLTSLLLHRPEFWRLLFDTAVKADGIVEDDVGEHWHSIKHLTAEQRKEARNPDVIGNRPGSTTPTKSG